jgi:hypothetical protein
MAAVATSSLIFTLFSTLPAELRNAIWRAALPDAMEPALVSFRPGCWRKAGPEDHPDLMFRHDLLNVHIAMPLAFVNREARSIALVWARKHGLTAQTRKDQYPTFVRRFEPTVDALHLGPGQLTNLVDEVVNQVTSPDL